MHEARKNLAGSFQPLAPERERERTEVGIPDPAHYEILGINYETEVCPRLERWVNRAEELDGSREKTIRVYSKSNSRKRLEKSNSHRELEITEEPMTY